MPTKSHSDAPEPTDEPNGPEPTDEPPGDSPVTTRADLRAETKPDKPTETVRVAGPGGTRITTSPETAEALKAAGYE